MSVELSVVICTYNRHDMLGRAITSIDKQSCELDLLELIVVDNSTKREAQDQFIKSLDVNINCKYFVEDIPGLSRARNIGISASVGRHVAFLDDDAEATANWAANIISRFANYPDVAIVGGPVRPRWPTGRPTWLDPELEGYLTILDRGPERRHLDAHEWLAGTNIAFRREVLQKAGGFSETLGRKEDILLSNEDLSACNAIRKMGYSVLYDPAIEVWHNVHEDRLNHPWMRRRVFWQVVSDIVTEGGTPRADFERCVANVVDYLARLPPHNRGVSGIFMDTNDPALFRQQLQALGSMARLMAADGHDWMRFGVVD
jgi:glycosyltransferase involved in cell wall biosynthesis